MLGILKRLFGGSKDKRAARPAGRTHPYRRSATGHVLAQGRRQGEGSNAKASAAEAGFDPYNTGKFDRAASWERVRHSQR